MASGQDLQDKFDELMNDLSARSAERGQALKVEIPLRLPNDNVVVYRIETDAQGVIDQAQRIDFQNSWLLQTKNQLNDFNSAKTVYDNSNTAKNIASIMAAKGEYSTVGGIVS